MKPTKVWEKYPERRPRKHMFQMYRIWTNIWHWLEAKCVELIERNLFPFQDSGNCEEQPCLSKINFYTEP